MRYIETVEVAPADLAAYPGNARIHDRETLAESVRANGQYRSIVARRRADGELEILAGHGTRDAFAEAGAERVRVEVIEADDAEARRIVLVDNRANDAASYDEALLLDLLAAASPDLAGTGFSPEALAELERQMDAALLGRLDYSAEWEQAGMPEYEAADLNSVVRATVHFRSQEDAVRFFELLGRPAARSFWWPETDGHVGLLSSARITATDAA